VAGATIIFSCDGEPCYGDSAVANPTAHYEGDAVKYASTDSGGHFIIGVLLGDHKSTHKIDAGFSGAAI
jgi:hypothetical protein